MISDHVAAILTEFTARGGALDATDWLSLGQLLRTIAPPVPNLPHDLWLDVMSRNVPVAVDVVVVSAARVLLVHRDWCGQSGYHVPGGYLAPGETFLAAAQRISERELGIAVSDIAFLGVVNNVGSPRFHDLAVLLRCTTDDSPRVGEWFNRKPKMLPVHDGGYWEQIKPLLDQANTG